MDFTRAYRTQNLIGTYLSHLEWLESRTQTKFKQKLSRIFGQTIDVLLNNMKF